MSDSEEDWLGDKKKTRVKRISDKTEKTPYLNSEGRNPSLIKAVILAIPSENYKRSQLVEGNALYYMCEFADSECIITMLDKGTKVDFSVTMDNGSPLQYAANFNNLEAIKTLLKFGANVNHSTFDGALSIHFAALRGYTQVVSTLIEAGSKLNKVSKK